LSFPSTPPATPEIVADFADEALRLRWAAASRLAELTPRRGARLGNPLPVDRLVVCHGTRAHPTP
jgi:HEAT repeat protein